LEPNVPGSNATGSPTLPRLARFFALPLLDCHAVSTLWGCGLAPRRGRCSAPYGP